MSIVKKRDNWGYAPDYSGQNYTQRFSRQSRITGEYSKLKRRIPPGDIVATVLGALALLMVLFV